MAPPTLRILQHPLHPAVTDFPVALLSSTLIWDGLAIWERSAHWWTISFWVMAAGLGGAAVAITTGLVDFIRLPTDHPAQGPALLHLIAVLAAVGLYSASLAVRGGASPHTGGVAALAVGLGLGGLTALVVGGWLGAELVFRHGLGRID